MLHRVIGDDDGFTRLGVEADRRAFLGRHGSAARPAGMEGEALSGMLVWTLDPVCAVRLSIELPPSGRRELYFVIIPAATPQSPLAITHSSQTPASLNLP